MGFLEFIPVIGKAADKLLDLIPDPNARAKAKEAFELEVQAAAQAADAGQREINLAEANSGNWFNSGWRPFIGWVIGMALASYYLPMHIMAAVLWVKAAWVAQTLPPWPIGMDDTLTQLIFGMLGMGALRTIEKVKGGK